MKLIDLNPKLEGSLVEGLIRFDCPLGHGHKFRIPIHAGPAGAMPRSDARNAGNWIWHAEGSFPDTLTISPSVDASGTDPFHPVFPSCGWHGFVRNGEVVP